MKLQTVIHRKNIIYFTVGLAMLTIMGILGVDTYLPSIPDIAKEFEKMSQPRSCRLWFIPYALVLDS